MPKADILIIDDTPTNLSLLSQMLTSQGYAVRLAKNGVRALESAQLLPPDLILLDIRMPGMDGFEVCRRLKAEESTRHVPVIFISALDDVMDKVRGFQAGGVDYITKPFQVEEVLVRTETHLSLRRLQRKLEETNRKMALEMALAGSMQANFLPRRLPEIPGWQLSATLKPARETSGDFFNAYPSADGRMVILLADVVDKGVSAALFMAYCCSLLRTFADEYPGKPAQVMAHTNRRILVDTNANQFVTVFFGMLDAQSGELVYCNAGHPPPLVFSPNEETPIARLAYTGIPLGIDDEVSWEEKRVYIPAGSLMVLYTDGLIEAFDASETQFGETRLRQSVQRHWGQPLRSVQTGLLDDVQAFAGTSHLEDDIALMLVSREC